MTTLKELMSRRPTQFADDRTLRIDCRGCGNEPDLSCEGCIRCICGMIEGKRSVERIIFRSGTEKQLEKDAVSVLNSLTAKYLSVRTGSNDPNCCRCILSEDALEMEKWTSLSLENIDEIIIRLDSVFVDCPWRCECIDECKRAFIQMRSGLKEVSEEAASAAFRIVGV